MGDWEMMSLAHALRWTRSLTGTSTIAADSVSSEHWESLSKLLPSSMSLPPSMSLFSSVSLL